MDGLLVPSLWVKEVFMRSGVTTPIEVIPFGVEGTVLNNVKRITDQYTFYSIFELSNRKDYVNLIHSYCAAFAGNRDVVLVIKTYMRGGKSALEHLNAVKQSINVDHPDIILIESVMSDEEIFELHQQCDCFLLPTRGEGFGMPIAEAMYFGNPVIVTGYSGQMEFCNHWNSYLTDYILEPITYMASTAYEGTMLWARANPMDLINHMRYVYDNQEEAKIVGLRGQETVKKKFTADLMMEAIFKNLQKFPICP
jgi:hypothetical protein